MTLRLSPGTDWAATFDRAVTLAPEGFADDRLRNLVEGAWLDSGTPTPLRTPVDGTVLAQLPRVHAELVQLLAGNAVVAKTPSQGGALCLTVAHALMREAGLPVTLLSGSGDELSEVLVRDPRIGAVAFVGGRSNGGKVAAALLDTDKRHFIEQEGLNAWGVWEFSQWDLLAAYLPDQDTRAYVAPSLLLAPPGRSRLMHAEPFGPVDTIVVVDTVDELLSAMNASNGALVASLACDDEELAGKLAVDLHAFKVG